MKRLANTARSIRWIVGATLTLAFALGSPGPALASIDGITPVDDGGNLVFDLTVRADHISTADGGSVYVWGYADGAGRAQYPGPTLILDEGQTVTVRLRNEIDEPVSAVFPGQEVTTSGGAAGLLTAEVPADAGASVVSYTFTADRPGTFLYHSGTSPELQIEMGLVGAIVVRPALGADHAYDHADTQFDREYLFLLTEMDPRIHGIVETSGAAALEDMTLLSSYFPMLWFINGRNGPDSLFPNHVDWLPTQPYGSVPLMHPGERLLMRVVGAGRDLHPFHHHGNHARVIARDGYLLESTPGAGADLSHEVFTIQSVPGSTVDAIFQWTGEGLGWDIYGTGPEYAHLCNSLSIPSASVDPVTHEDCSDHGKPLPVQLPSATDLTFGGFWSGSPFLGDLGSLPPAEGGLNPYGGFTYMWHSHTEKELTNFDVFPGGMMTMLIIEHPDVPIND